MKGIRLQLAFISLAGILPTASAGTMGQADYNNGYYAGVGGSFNAARLRTDTSAVLTATSGFTPLGVLSGSTGEYKNSDHSAAFEAKLGYQQTIQSSPWLWNIEFLYQYSGIKMAASGAEAAPGTRFFLTSNTSFITDELRTNRVETKMNNAFMLPLGLGHLYSRGSIYAAAGPALFKLQHHRFMTSDNLSALYVGTINDFPMTNWLWGGVMQAGLTWFIEPQWFLKMNYSYGLTGKKINSNTVGYAANLNNGLNDGTLRIANRERYTTQSIALSINRMFG